MSDMDIDIFLLVLVIFVVVVSVAVNIKILTYYQQKEDSAFASSVLCKAIIVISMTFAWLVNLLLPIDVRNSRPTPGILDMQLMWTIAFVILAVFLVLIVPAAMFYHEVEGDDFIKKKRGHVLCNLSLTLFFTACTVLIGYPFLSEAEIPVVRYACGGTAWSDGDAEGEGLVICGDGQKTDLTIQVSFDIYLIACLCFVGWFFLVTFGGIGLSAVPIDLILEFIDRPRAIDELTFQQRKRVLGHATMTLLSNSRELEQRDTELSSEKGWKAGRKKRQLKADYNKFKKDVLLLEEEHEKLKVCKFQKGESLAVSITKLVAGILFAIMSLAWVFHILFYIVTPEMMPDGQPVSLFLNELFEAFESTGVYPLGVAFFAAFTLYLLLCVVKGCLKFGMRIFFFFSIHPMRHEATPLNSILFNVELMLITSAAVVQFSQQAFADYARLTDADVIFAAQIKYMKFFRYFFENNVFIYTLLIWFLLTLIYLFAKPKDQSGVIKFDKKKDKKMSALANFGKKADPSPASSAGAAA